jgi:hypothetical protein
MRPAKELDHDEMGTRCDLVRRARVELLEELISMAGLYDHAGLDTGDLEAVLEEARTK